MHLVGDLFELYFLYFCRKRRRYLCLVVISSDISQNWNVSKYLVDVPNMKSHDNPCSGSRVVPREQTNGWTDVTRPSPLSLTSITVLCSNLREVLPSGLLPSSSPSKLCTHFFPKRAAYLSLLDLVIRIIYGGEQYRS